VAAADDEYWVRQLRRPVGICGGGIMATVHDSGSNGRRQGGGDARAAEMAFDRAAATSGKADLPAPWTFRRMMTTMTTGGCWQAQLQIGWHDNNPQFNCHRRDITLAAWLGLRNSFPLSYRYDVTLHMVTIRWGRWLLITLVIGARLNFRRI
jgi:hypothetical protein